MLNRITKPLFCQTRVVRSFFWFTKFFTHNYCDSCGWTKNKIYTTKLFSEAGYLECSECIIKPLK